MLLLLSDGSVRGDVKLFTHLFRAWSVHIDTKAHSQHLGFSGGQAAEHVFASRRSSPVASSMGEPIVLSSMKSPGANLRHRQ